MIYGDLLYTVIGIGLGALAFWMAIFAEKNKNTSFKLIYVLPMIWSVFMIMFGAFEKTLVAAYIMTFIVLVGFFIEKKIVRQAVSVLLILTMAGEIAFCSTSQAYRVPDFVKAFNEGIETMKEHYVLADYKGIDFDKLYDEYLPLFEEVNKTHDKVGNAILWTKFSLEFCDGHVAYVENMSGDFQEEYYRRLYGNDYGLSLVRCSDGRAMAVNVTEGSSTYEAGIHNGTVIVSWDGMPIEEFLAKDDLPLYMDNMPVKENEDFLKVICSAGQGGENIQVAFIDNEGKERKASLKAEGSYYNRMNKTIGLLLDGRFETNLTVTKMDENTGVVRLSSMGYDSQSYSGGDYSKMYEELKTNLQSLKDEGVTNLIFDLRSNTGGSPQFDNVIFRLILPEGEYPMSYNCLWDEAKNAFMIDDNTGKYVVGDPIMATGEGFWGQGKIVVLVNANTISAGDLFTEVMSRFDNVTIMGITPSNCSCQAIKAIEVGNGLIQFSSIPNLTENGDFYIDCDSTRKATIPLDEKIEINQEFIDEIFNKGTDYILDQAVEYCQ